mmetsp:Transcript_1296/g.1340  ORF Transcript_1296/g.1340 Transcript_1296/m.1340 type:complete len:156 (+) Transcript_1296:7-474(+)
MSTRKNMEQMQTDIVKGWQLPWQGRSIVCCRGKCVIGPLQGLSLSLTLMILIIIGWYSFYMFQDILIKNGFSQFFIYSFHVIVGYTLYCDVMAHISDPGVLLQNQSYKALLPKKDKMKEYWEAKLEKEKIIPEFLANTVNESRDDDDNEESQTNP